MMNPFKYQKLPEKTNVMLLEEHIDDIVEMIEDYCLMMMMDHSQSATTLVGIREWSLLNDQEWLMLLEQLKQVKIFGMSLHIVEKYNHDQEIDELHLSWGFKS